MNFLRFLMIIGVAIAIGSTSFEPKGVHGLPAHSELTEESESSETVAAAEPMNDEALAEITEMLADPQNHIQVIKMKSPPSGKLKIAQGETDETPLPPTVSEQLDMAMALGENMMTMLAAEEEAEAEAEAEKKITETAAKDPELVKAAAALTDEEITEIVKMIQFPPDRVEEIVEDQDAYDKSSTDIEHRTAVDHAIVEPRSGRSLASEEEELLLLEDPSTGRLISQRQFQRAMRRMMRQIKRATRNMTSRNKRKTSSSNVKDTDGISNDEDTVENFLRRLYASAGKQKKKSGLMSLIG